MLFNLIKNLLKKNIQAKQKKYEKYNLYKNYFF